MRRLLFAKPTALIFEGEYVSDHNREPISVDYERIETRERTSRGFLRTYFRADKARISTQWDELPETRGDTVDGGMGAKDLEKFYLDHPGLFNVRVAFDVGDYQDLQMAFESFNITLNSRRGTNLYSVQIGLEEV